MSYASPILRAFFQLRLYSTHSYCFEGKNGILSKLDEHFAVVNFSQELNYNIKMKQQRKE